LSHFDLPVGEAVQPYGFFCRRACQGVFRMRVKITSIIELGENASTATE
jgi:hypothetical protein